MKYACFSSMGRFFFSVLRGGGDEMVREDTKADSHSEVAARCGADVHCRRGGSPFCRLTLRGADTPMKNDGKQRISLLLTNMFLNLWLLKS